MIGTTFSPLTFDNMTEYRALCAKTPTNIADATFSNIWGWAEYYGIEWRMAHGLCWLRQTRHGDDVVDLLWAPVGDWTAADWQAMPEFDGGAVLERVPEALSTLLMDRFPGRVNVEETQGQWEYLYETDDLANLVGNKLHKKRNHVNGYLKAYGEDYRVLGSADIDAVLALQHDWCKWRECSKSLSLLAENKATERVLSSWDALGTLVGGALYVDNEMVAFSVGEALDANTLVVHFEKGRPEYRGVYQAMNYFFARNAGQGFQLLNREQDTDEEGLRKAKQSYMPTGFLKKNRVLIQAK